MSRQPEGRLQRRIRKAIELKFGGFWFKTHGGPFQMAGIPDLIGFVAGVPFGLEVKTKTGKSSPIQDEVINRMNAAGCCACVVRTAKDALIFVRNSLRERQLKPCCSCRLIKDVREFHPHPRYGSQGRCKDCSAIHRKEATHKNRLKYLYDITPDQLEGMIGRRRGKCDICGKKPKIRLCVDHCHKTGKVRGLLCTGCNASIGHLGDNAKSLRRAMDYLESYE